MSIEFRVWDEEEKAMVYSSDIAEAKLRPGETQHGDELVITMEGQVCLYCCDIPYLRVLKNVILLQYTNKIDLTGKKIFDKDWIRWMGNYFHVCQGYENSWYGMPHFANPDRGMLMASSFRSSTVVGNIYETEHDGTRRF